MRVYAENEEEARENVALNGWQILSIEEVMAQPMQDTQMRGAEAAASFSMSVTKVGEGTVEPEGDVQVAQGDSLQVSFKPGPCEKLGKLIYNGQEVMPSDSTYTLDNVQKDGFVVAVFEHNGTACEDNGIFNANLTEVGSVYFKLGEFTKKLTDDDMKAIAAANPDKNYVIIGHTDDVHVVPNKEYADNFQLSVKRAQFLMKQLTDKGFKSDMIKTVGLGPAFPAAPNKKEGQPLNRRAVLYERR